MNPFRKYRRALSAALTTLMMATISIDVVAADGIRSTGVFNGTDSAENTVIIDADDIRQNYAAILQIQKQLAGLSGKSLEWSDDMATYVVVTYKKDENGDIVTDEEGNPEPESIEPIGALGTADPTMVVENRSFSSLYAKTIYNGSSTKKAPGVQQNGTLVDVLHNGWSSNQLSGQAYYTENDTLKTGNSTREKQSESQAPDQTTADLSGRTSTLTLDDYNPTTTSASFGTQTETSEYSSNAGKLTETKSSLVLGANDSVTLPAGYYNKQVTISNGVINRTRNDKVTVSGLVGSKGEAAANGNITKTFADGDYDISVLDNVNSYLYLGAKSAVTFPAGYYSKPITVENSVTDRSNTVLKVEANYDAASMSTSDKSKEGTAKKGQYSTATNGSNPSVNSNGKIVLGINESITLPAGYYENPITVSNGVVNKGSIETVLTKNKSTIDLEAGYYSKAKIATNVPDIPAKIEYNMGHVHTGSSSRGGGCYGRSETKACGGSGAITGEDWGGYYFDTDGDGQLDQNHFWVGSCTSCGNRLYGDYLGQVVRCDNTVTVWHINCGKSEGQIVRTTQDLSTKTANEKIVSAFITYE